MVGKTKSRRIFCDSRTLFEIQISAYMKTVLLEPGHAHSSMYCSWLLGAPTAEPSSCNRNHGWPEKLKIFTIWLFMEKVCQPSFHTHWHSLLPSDVQQRGGAHWGPGTDVTEGGGGMPGAAQESSEGHTCQGRRLSAANVFFCFALNVIHIFNRRNWDPVKVGQIRTQKTRRE